MTEYVQMRTANLDGMTEDEDVLSVAYALFEAWFPRHHITGLPTGEDLENWKAIAVADAEVVIERLRDLGLLLDSDSAMVPFNDE